MNYIKNRSNAPIGVFDSGLGGLTVVREIRKVLPREDIIYFGDLARLPYGIKSERQVIEFSKQNASFLLEKGVKALVVACNTSASASLNILKRLYSAPIIDVIVPTAEEAVKRTHSGRIGVIGTQATISSKAYEKAIKRARKDAVIFSGVCSLFVPLVEEGRLAGPIARSVANEYLKDFGRKRIDVIILGCTHYPLLKGVIRGAVGKDVELIDSAPSTVLRLKSELRERGLLAERKRGTLKIFVSDRPRNFIKVGERFLGRKMDSVKLVRL